MKRNQLLTKTTAVILLLVFSQKLGGGLYLHNWLHKNIFEQASASHAGDHVKNAPCTCIDDFSMPLSETSADISLPLVFETPDFNATYKNVIPFSSTFFFSRRAPPCTCTA